MWQWPKATFMPSANYIFPAVSSQYIRVTNQPTNQPTNDIGYNERRDNCAYMRSNAQIKNVLTKSA